MTAEAIGVHTLERLSSLDTRGLPVLSVYLDLDPARFPTPAAREVQLRALLGEAGHEGAEAEVDRVAALLRSEPAMMRGVRGLAIFSSAEADVLETVGLPSPVEPIVVVDTVPWLEPLAGMIAPGDWGVAVVSRSAARLFRGGPHRLAQFAAVHDEVHRRHAQGGWSQARYQRGIEEEVASHVRGVTERLLRAHRRRPFDHLAIVASGELRPVIEHSLHSELANVLAGTVDADLEHAPTDEIARAVSPVIERAERDRERAFIARLEQALATGGAAAAGLDEVLSTLQAQRVEALLIPERSSLTAHLCPRCGRLSATDSGACPFDGAPLGQVDPIAHAIEQAARQSADVVVIHHETDSLTKHGHIAALLRW
jgi:peptide chain release factor subunit 1